MRISLPHLRRWVDLPGDEALRALFDDLGLEVKRVHADEGDGPAFTLELLANRGDHRCYLGVARELHARLGGTLRLPAVAPLPVGPAPHPIRVETPRCLVYTLTRLDRVGDDAPLDPEARRVLRVAGLNPVLPVVDATNVASLELGQPTHAFDADTVVGPITLRDSRPGERAWPLFQPGPVELPAGTLVVADDEKILAIAGVIGCEESKTTAATTAILLESATFDPVAVRVAARALGILTDASARFERGADPAAPLPGAGRVAELLVGTGAWRVTGTAGVAGAWQDPVRTVRLDLARASAFLGLPVDAARVETILGRHGFACAGGDAAVTVRVPPHRLWDVETEADLHEELAKAIGYNAVPTALPPVDAGAVPTEAELRRERVEEVLLAEGFLEIVTNGFYGRPLVEALGVGPGHALFDHVETLNALDRGYSLLKNNPLAQAVETVATNVRVKNPEVRAYEWTRTFHPTGTGSLAERRSPCTERAVLWAVVTGTVRPDHWSGRPPAVDVWYLKGLVEAIAAELRLPLEVAAGDPAAPIGSLLHPHRQARVRLRGADVGWLGEVHPAITARLKLRGVVPYYLELDADALTGAPVEPPAFEEPPTMPPMARQLALVVPTGVEAARVIAALRGAGVEGLEEVRVIDLFEADTEAGRLRVLTFDLTWTATRERTAEAVNGAIATLVAAAEAAIPGVRLRA